ncbi:pentatricopeptide repeat-containing protein At2g04860 [Cajanus cajan]|uniref:pentatricopeptide repeat-containing protein At2g04860 n=1 Tax=Cajanus cajan TaxID=3821 RepID=UPI00098D9A52|nr:pentatricopeptide repeat-containing protein At2g04860 [Cajanus cajan]XP_020219795.1 pentatricopeptide repeat-containing protein At2g04860 [Cajanus cajan]
MKLASNLNLSLFHDASSALLIFRHFLQANANPNHVTFSLLIKTCLSHSSFSSTSRIQVHQIHTQLLKRGIDQFLYVNTALIDFYMKLGFTTHARQLFEDMPSKDVVSWNVLICGYSQNGHPHDALQLFVHMLRQSFRPNQTTIASLLPSCSCRELFLQGRSLHGFGIKAGLGLDPQLSNALTSMYAKCDDLEASHLLFEEMAEKNVVSWNTMIGAYGQNGFLDKAVLCFKEMLKEGLQPSPVTMINLMSANAVPQTIHCYIIKCGFTSDASVVTSLVCLYAKQRFTDMAKLIYESYPTKDLISLTAIISSYCEKGDVESAVECFIQTMQLDIKPDAVALISVLHGITNPSHFPIGCAFHGYGLKNGLSNDCLVVNGLISMYSRFDEIEAALSLFFDRSEKPLATWNSVISGCVQAGKSSDAMELFCQMNMYGQKPDAITVTSLLSGCCQLGYLRIGETLHGYILRNNVKVEDFTGTALIDMYTKCGRLDYAEKVFYSINDPCLATWNSIISGYSLYGLEHKAFSCFSKLQEHGLEPDKITFLGVLAACTHGGLFYTGMEYFCSMTKEYGLMPNLQHYACIVGLLGRTGLFKEAIEIINNMEIRPDSAVWGALLSACCIQEDVKLGECLAKKLFLLNYKNGGFYVLMSNLYAIVGRWDDVARVRDMMRDIGGDGCSGASVIEVTPLRDSNNLCPSEFHLNTSTWQHLCLY